MVQRVTPASFCIYIRRLDDINVIVFAVLERRLYGYESECSFVYFTFEKLHCVNLLSKHMACKLWKKSTVVTGPLLTW